MTKRFYIGKKEADELEDLEEWIASRVPLPPPKGTQCEDDQCMGEGDEWDEETDSTRRPEATTYVYRIEDGHVCYTYVCGDCGERADEGYLGRPRLSHHRVRVRSGAEALRVREEA